LLIGRPGSSPRSSPLGEPPARAFLRCSKGAHQKGAAPKL
jgi:hypothetical protein